MSAFSVAWLDLREGADLAARDRALAREALRWLESGTAGGTEREAIVVDLGAGTGSTLRALAALGAGKLVWRLVDQNGELLDEALRRHRRTFLIEDYKADLRVLDELPLGGARLVTASALFDLASCQFVDSLAARLTQSGEGLAGAAPSTGLYAALNYDGTTTWAPEHPLDADVLAAFNKDQRQDKGLGPALGPDAASYLQQMLTNSGFSVSVAASPWVLGAADAELVSELIRGIAAAVADGYGLDAAALQQWQSFRLDHAASGSCTVGHQDVLALPA